MDAKSPAWTPQDWGHARFNPRACDENDLCSYLLPIALRHTREDEYTGAALLRVVRSFDPARGSFRNWFYRKIGRAIQDLRKCAEFEGRVNKPVFVPFGKDAGVGLESPATPNSREVLEFADHAEQWTARATLHALLLLGWSRVDCQIVFGFSKAQLNEQLHLSLAHFPLPDDFSGRLAAGRG